VQDVRGRFDSDGEWHPYMHERRDGFDTVEWIHEQPWCDGNIGMIGRSYVAYTQWMAAADRPKGLKAIVPISPQADLYHGYPFVNGVFVLAMGELGVKGGRHSFQIRDFMMNVMCGPEPYFDTLPVSELLTTAGVAAPPWWLEMMDHPNHDEYWQQGSYRDSWSEMDVAALNVTGWFDLVVEGAIENFAGMQRHGRTESARRGQQLVVGPWAHWVNTRIELEGIDFGEGSRIDLEGLVIAFFDRWLKRSDAGPAAPDVKPVHVFVMGANEWWEAETWPLPDAQEQPLYLRGGGELSTDLPEREEPDSYFYDPHDPVTSLWSMHAGPVDDREIALRDDVLSYIGPPLEEPMHVVGPVTLVLFASSTALDADWHARLLDVHEDGSRRFVCHGVLRSRFRESFSEPVLLEPGQVTRFEVRLTPTAIRFDSGHRIGLEITSSWFPRFERNMGSGAPNNLKDDDAQTATQSVFHDRDSPSHLLLPIVKVDDTRAASFAPRSAAADEAAG
jgi:putative CocE/NonD family hydrolase